MKEKTNESTMQEKKQENKKKPGRGGRGEYMCADPDQVMGVVVCLRICDCDLVYHF